MAITFSTVNLHCDDSDTINRDVQLQAIVHAKPIDMWAMQVYTLGRRPIVTHGVLTGFIVSLSTGIR